MLNVSGVGSNLNLVTPAALDLTRGLFLEVQRYLQAQHVAVLVRDASSTLWTHHASGWFTHLRSYGVKEGVGLSWMTLNARSLQIFANPWQHPSVFSPEPNDGSKQIQVSVPFFGSQSQPLGVLHILRDPWLPFQKRELAWLSEQSQGITALLETALMTEIQFTQALGVHAVGQLVCEFALYLGEPLPIAQAMAWAVLPQSKISKNTLPLETRLALQQQECRFDGTGTPALVGSNISISARVVQVVLAYSKHLEQGLSLLDALAALRREAGWKLDPLLVHALEQHLR
jgi:hypothetical protein